jgi:hypothetical protein
MDMNELEKEQSSKKPTSTTDAASTEWMDEWIARVTGAPKKPRNPNKGPSTSGAAAAMAMDIPEKNDVSQQAIDIYTFFL